MKNYLTAKELAEILGVHINTIQNWRKKNQGPEFVRLPNGTIRYPRGAFSKWYSEFIAFEPVEVAA